MLIRHIALWRLPSGATEDQADELVQLFQNAQEAAEELGAINWTALPHAIESHKPTRATFSQECYFPSWDVARAFGSSDAHTALKEFDQRIGCTTLAYDVVLED
jgi:hypothetical protein